MRGDDRSAADEILSSVKAHAGRWRLGHTADHRRMRETVDDRVADDVDGDAAELVENGTQSREIERLRMHEHEKLVERQVWRTRLDECRGGIDDVAGREQNLAAIAFDRFHLLLRLRVDAAGLILVTLGEEVGLYTREIADGRRLGIDDDVIHHLERGEI